MADTKIGGIHVAASIDAAEFVQGAKKIQSESKKTEAVVESSFSGMSSAVRGFGGALTAGLSIGLLAGFAKKALDFAAAIGTTAKQLGVTTKELQLFRYAADQVGVKNAEADKGLEKLGVTLGKAEAGSRTAAKALAAVGVSVEDIKTKSRTEIFGQIADQMLKQGGAAKNAAAANAIFGESASKLSPLLDKGSQGINELSAAAQRLGIVLSDRQIQQADQTAQKLDDVRAVLSAQVAGVVADNAAAIVSLANALGSLTSSIINFLGSNPQAALGILGAIAGARFGAAGAVAGGIAGLTAGSKVAAGARDANTDLRFRAQQIRKAQAELARTKTLYGGGPAGAQDRARAAAEVKRQTELGNKALAAARAGPSAPASAGIPQFLAPAAKSGGGRKGRTARAPRAPRDRSADVEFQFAEELRRAHMDVLRAQQSLAGTSDERASIALEMLDLEKVSKNAELDDRVRRAKRDLAEGKIDEGTLQKVELQAEELRKEYAKQDAIDREAILRDQRIERMERQDIVEQRGFRNQLEDLQFADDMAETRADHLRIQLEIVDVIYKQKEAHLRALKAELDLAGKIEEAADVQAEIDRLPTERGQDRDRVSRGNRSPLADWKAQWGDIGDENEQALVSALDNMADALSRVTDGWKAMKKAALDTLKSLFQELLSNQLKQLFAMAIPQGGLGSIFGGGAKVPGFATGGSFSILGKAGVDKNVLSLNGLPIARVSHGERVSIAANGNTPSSGGSGIRDLNFNVYTNDANSFRRSESQIARETRRRLGV